MVSLDPGTLYLNAALQLIKDYRSTYDKTFLQLAETELRLASRKGKDISSTREELIDLLRQDKVS